MVVFLLLCRPNSYAQLSDRNKTKKDIVLSGNFHFGKAIKHTSKFKPDIPNMSVMAEINFGVNVSGKKFWNHRFHFPEVGASFIYADFGNSVELGRAAGLYPYISFPVVHREKYKFQIRLGSGIAYLTKPYDVIDNPTNNVIGSHLNDITQLKFINNIKLSDRWNLLAAFAFTHFSNGNVQKPNLGINVLSGNIGFQYVPNDKPQKFDCDTSDYQKRFMTLVKTGIGINEANLPGAGKYAIYSITALAIKPTSRVNRLQLGVEYEFRGDSYVNLQASIDRQEEVKRMDVSRFAIVAGDEIVFHNVALSLQLGFYVNKFEQKPFVFYNKTGVVYYVPLFKDKPSLFVGVYLKSHKFVADYIEYGIGYVF